MEPEASADRRELERFPVTRSVELTTSRSASGRFEGIILDFSERGLRISTTRELIKDESITVRWGERQLVGTVVHCNLGPSGFLAGISLGAAQ